MVTEIKNLKKAVNRILKAVADKERIILYGDADLDGVASVIILEEAIKDLGGKAEAVYFPDRENEGYGINETALNYLRDKAQALFIALDCGIGNFEEIKTAVKLGFEIMIIDHHQVLKQLPEASIIVDPRQKGDKYPFKELAAAGVVYRLAKMLLRQAAKWPSPDFIRGGLELVALATLADMMILEKENKTLVEEGLLALTYTKRPGLMALMDLSGFRAFGPRIEEAKKNLIAPLNSGGPCRHLNEIYLILTETDAKKARRLARILIEKSYQKKEEIYRITKEVEARIGAVPSLPFIFEGDSSWPLILLGPVASRICQRYQRPVFLFKKGGEESPGAVRAPQGVDSVKIMEKCRRFLKTYGGHAPASGFRLKNGNLEKFKNCLTRYFNA